jgi:hypothetical protein
MKSNRKLIMNLHGIQGNPEKPQQKGNGKTSNEGILPLQLSKLLSAAANC